LSKSGTASLSSGLFATVVHSDSRTNTETKTVGKTVTVGFFDRSGRIEGGNSGSGGTTSNSETSTTTSGGESLLKAKRRCRRGSRNSGEGGVASSVLLVATATAGFDDSRGCNGCDGSGSGNGSRKRGPEQGVTSRGTGTLAETGGSGDS